MEIDELLKNSVGERKKSKKSPKVKQKSQKVARPWVSPRENSRSGNRNSVRLRFHFSLKKGNRWTLIKTKGWAILKFSEVFWSSSEVFWSCDLEYSLGKTQFLERKKDPSTFSTLREKWKSTISFQNQWLRGKSQKKSPKVKQKSPKVARTWVSPRENLRSRSECFQIGKSP